MKATAWILVLGLAGSAQAGVFVLTGTAGTAPSQTYSWDSIDTAIDALQASQLQALLPAYTGVEVLNVSLSLRGEPVLLSFPSTGGTTLVFSIPSLGITQSFTGLTRDESQKLWRDYLKNNTQLLEGLMRQLVKSSPVDPIAGNPNSLMTRSVQQDYDVMLRNASDGAASGASSNGFGTGLVYGSMWSEATANAAAMRSDSYTVPFSYRHSFSRPNQEFRLNLPLTITKVGSAKVYETNLSGYYRHPLAEKWALSGQTGVRATGSRELGSVGLLGSYSAMSSYSWGSAWQLTMGNLIGRNQTLTMKAGGDSFNPQIRNTVYRNGFLLATDGGWEWFAVDTRFAGTELFNRWQDEVGFSYGSARNAQVRDSDIRAGFTYVKAQRAHGFRVNFGVWF